MVDGRKYYYTDALTFPTMYRDAFIDQANDFIHSGNHAPVILDCGSNIGLTVLRFKQLYPDARILAFEPDPLIFECLAKNIKEWGLLNVELHQAAIWIDNDGITFNADHATGGRIVDGMRELIEVPTIRLYDLLDAPIDFLKLDIEGAEHRVLPDCGVRLGNISSFIIEWHFRADEKQNLSAALLTVENAGFRYNIHHCWPVRVNRKWNYKDDQLVSIITIHGRQRD